MSNVRPQIRVKPKFNPETRKVEHVAADKPQVKVKPRKGGASEKSSSASSSRAKFETVTATVAHIPELADTAPSGAMNAAANISEATTISRRDQSQPVNSQKLTDTDTVMKAPARRVVAPKKIENNSKTVVLAQGETISEEMPAPQARRMSETKKAKKVTIADKEVVEQIEEIKEDKEDGNGKTSPPSNGKKKTCPTLRGVKDLMKMFEQNPSKNSEQKKDGRQVRRKSKDNDLSSQKAKAVEVTIPLTKDESSRKTKSLDAEIESNLSGNMNKEELKSKEMPTSVSQNKPPKAKTIEQRRNIPSPNQNVSPTSKTVDADRIQTTRQKSSNPPAVPVKTVFKASTEQAAATAIKTETEAPNNTLMDPKIKGPSSGPSQPQNISSFSKTWEPKVAQGSNKAPAVMNITAGPYDHAVTVLGSPIQSPEELESGEYDMPNSRKVYDPATQMDDAEVSAQVVHDEITTEEYVPTEDDEFEIEAAVEEEEEEEAIEEGEALEGEQEEALDENRYEEIEEEVEEEEEEEVVDEEEEEEVVEEEEEVVEEEEEEEVVEEEEEVVEEEEEVIEEEDEGETFEEEEEQISEEADSEETAVEVEQMDQEDVVWESTEAEGAGEVMFSGEAEEVEYIVDADAEMEEILVSGEVWESTDNLEGMEISAEADDSKEETGESREYWISADAGEEDGGVSVYGTGRQAKIFSNEFDSGDYGDQIEISDGDRHDLVTGRVARSEIKLTVPPSSLTDFRGNVPDVVRSTGKRQTVSNPKESTAESLKVSEDDGKSDLPVVKPRMSHTRRVRRLEDSESSLTIAEGYQDQAYQRHAADFRAVSSSEDRVVQWKTVDGKLEYESEVERIREKFKPIIAARPSIQFRLSEKTKRSTSDGKERLAIADRNGISEESQQLTNGLETLAGEREEDKKDMSLLNERLVEYVEKTRFLEVQNKILAAEAEVLKSEYKVDKVNLIARYDVEIAELKRLIALSTTKCGEAETKVASAQENMEHHENQLQDIEAVIEANKSKKNDLLLKLGVIESDLATLRRKVGDFETSSKRYRGSIQHLRKEKALLYSDIEKEIVATELAKDKACQLKGDVEIVKEAEKSEIIELAELDIRGTMEENRELWHSTFSERFHEIYADYISRMEAMHVEGEAAFLTAVLEQQLQDSNCSAEAQKVLIDTQRLRQQIYFNAERVLDLETRISQGELKMKYMIDERARISAEHEETRQALEQELQNCKAELKETQERMKIVFDRKLDLEAEITRFAELLSGEEARIDEDIVSVIKDQRLVKALRKGRRVFSYKGGRKTSSKSS